ncbi:4-hydroxy-tetrahydrodipicolinate synthase [Plastorhodobacter daqingensis]|uniref:4-hydroxy-tetrahydrodipicolinate synthase n=1 Tax=Plastorhodobacter daqingensis TaxID=1387281 RepID=A0ABW2UPN3_9RHOB
MTDATLRLRGVFTALVTPFDETGGIDWAAFDRLIDRQLEAGIAGLVPVGTTGEAATLEPEEAEALIAHTVKRVAGRTYVLAGTGTNNTRKSIEATKRAENAGADGVLLITPYYNKPTQDGLIAHFGAIADSTSCDVMLYSVPGRTGVAIAPETAAHLARAHQNIIAIKEAGGDPARVTALRAAAGAEFAVHSGDDGLALPFYALGACGLTSVLSNFAPDACVAQYRAFVDGRMQTALEWHERMAELVEALFAETSPGPVKRALALSNQMSDTMRLPMVRIGEATERRLAQALARYTASARPGIV